MTCTQRRIYYLYWLSKEGQAARDAALDAAGRPELPETEEEKAVREALLAEEAEAAGEEAELGELEEEEEEKDTRARVLAQQSKALDEQTEEEEGDWEEDEMARLLGGADPAKTARMAAGLERRRQRKQVAHEAAKRLQGGDADAVVLRRVAAYLKAVLSGGSPYPCITPMHLTAKPVALPYDNHKLTLCVLQLRDDSFAAAHAGSRHFAVRSALLETPAVAEQPWSTIKLQKTKDAHPNPPTITQVNDQDPGWLVRGARPPTPPC